MRFACFGYGDAILQRSFAAAAKIERWSAVERVGKSAKRFRKRHRGKRLGAYPRSSGVFAKFQRHFMQQRARRGLRKDLSALVEPLQHAGQQIGHVVGDHPRTEGNGEFAMDPNRRRRRVEGRHPLCE